MSSKRASLHTISSLLRLCKGYGCCSHNIVDCIKTLNALRAISTAAKWSDFQSFGGNQTDDSVGYSQNSGGLHLENRSKTNSHQLLNRPSPDYVAQANPSGFGGSLAGNPQSIDQNWGYAEGLRNECVNKLGEHGKKLNGSYGNTHGSINRYYCQRNTKMQNLAGVGVDYSQGFMKQPNAVIENHNWTQESRGRTQYPNAYISPGLLESQRNLKGNLTQNGGGYQQSPNVHYSGSTEMYQQYTGSGKLQQNLSAGQYLPHLNAKPNDESAGPYRGTIEELDSFCMEGKVKEAVEVLESLEKLHIFVDLPRYLQLMHQCGEAKSLKEAKIVHQHVLQYLSPLKVSTYHKILEMYFECGSVDDALKVFNNMPERNLTTWDTMITQLAKNGCAEDSADLFTQFKNLGLKPDGQMFIGVFYACSMLGDIDEGMLHFESMCKDYGIVPSMAHYVSIVEMIGSVGYLDEALEFIEKMPMEPSADVWETLMNLCRAHGNTELGDRCAELVEQLDPSRLNEQSKAGLVPVKASDLTKEKEKQKLASNNPLQVKTTVRQYRAGDTSHPENDKLYVLLRGMKSQMKEAGYIPETKFVLHDIDQEGKEEALLSHSERLAVAHGLLSSSARSPIRVIKNLRVCGDCHNAMKIISKIVGRELIMRDAKRFHHFKDGVCSCGDYW